MFQQLIFRGVFFLKHRVFLPQQKKDVISYNSVLAACAKASCWKQAVAKPGAIDFTQSISRSVNIWVFS